MISIEPNESELYQFGLRIGRVWGKELSEFFKDREIPSKPVVVELLVDQLATYENFSTSTRMIMAAGTENFGVLCNTGITTAGAVTCGLSSLNLARTNSPTARVFYAMSCAFSAGATGFGGSSVLARKCEVSELAFLSEAFGIAFLVLGNKAHAAALVVEGRPVPARFRRPVAQFGLFNRGNNAAFVMPFKCSSVIAAIPFEKIGRTVGFSISIYCYGRILLSAYRYGQQLVIAYKKKKFLKSNKVVTLTRFILSQSVFWKRRRLYLFVVS